MTIGCWVVPSATASGEPGKSVTVGSCSRIRLPAIWLVVPSWLMSPRPIGMPAFISIAATVEALTSSIAPSAA